MERGEEGYQVSKTPFLAFDLLFRPAALDEVTGPADSAPHTG